MTLVAVCSMLRELYPPPRRITAFQAAPRGRDV